MRRSSLACIWMLALTGGVCLMSNAGSSRSLPEPWIGSMGAGADPMVFTRDFDLTTREQSVDYLRLWSAGEFIARIGRLEFGRTVFAKSSASGEARQWIVTSSRPAIFGSPMVSASVHGLRSRTLVPREWGDLSKGKSVASGGDEGVVQFIADLMLCDDHSSGSELQMQALMKGQVWVDDKPYSKVLEDCVADKGAPIPVAWERGDEVPFVEMITDLIFDATVLEGAGGAVVSLEPTRMRGGGEAVVAFRLTLSHELELEGALTGHEIMTSPITGFGLVKDLGGYCMVDVHGYGELVIRGREVYACDLFSTVRIKVDLESTAHPVGYSAKLGLGFVGEGTFQSSTRSPGTR